MKQRFALLFCLTALAAWGQQSQLGKIDFPTSAQGEAQKRFVQGVLLLHNFEYDDAREQFQAASKAEPRFAMAYWGEALTHTHPLWGQQDLAAARAALQKLASTADERLALAPTEREKGYLRAVEALYAGEDKRKRDLEYAALMTELMKKYPDDLEAASFCALAVLATSQHGRQFPVYMKAAAIAEEVYAKNPQHPGALHYLIHAYDDPTHAPLGLRPARVYGEIAGAASHARHMPSHIFFALGMWDEAIAANEASVAVADERVKRKGLGADHRNYHSLLWLEYSYLQTGRVADARRLLEGIDPGSRELARMRATYAVETGEWDTLTTTLDGSKGDVVQGVTVLSTQGLVAIRQGQVEKARQFSSEARRRLGSTEGSGSGESHHGGGITASYRKASEIMVEQIEALVLHADGKREEALRLLEKTVQEEEGLGMEIGLEIGPPMPLKPAHELYGEVLLAEGKLEEAREHFRLALAKAPGRALSLKGLNQNVSRSSR